MSKLSLSAAFAAYGAKAKNPRWSWSARSPDGKTVVLALWQEGFSGKPMRYDGRAQDPTKAPWQATPGNRERIENLIWANDHCEGRFRIVFLKRDKRFDHPWRIEEPFVSENLWMKIMYLDRETGDFTAEAIP